MTERALLAPVWLLTIVVLVWALQAAAVVMAPVACAFFVIALAWPLQHNLQRFLPRLAALAIVVSLIALVFLAFASITSWGFGRIVRATLADIGRYETFYNRLSEWLEGYGIAMGGVVAEHINAGSILRMVQVVSQRLNTLFSFSIVAIVYVLLGLLDTQAFAHNARNALSPKAADVLINGTALTASKLRRYMLVRTLMSLATGLLVWALASVSGLRLAAEWGTIAFVLNYIPFIGPFIATLLPTFYAFVQFGSPEAALLIFAGLNVIQFIIGSYIEPRIAGYALAITPLVVLFSVFFWAFIWGAFGAFIGVPITIAILTYCAQLPSTAWIARLLGSPAGEAGKAGSNDSLA